MAAAAPPPPAAVHECSICMIAYSTDAKHIRAPKVLLCGHTFCADCIAKGRKAPGSSNPICPLCAKESNVQAEQVPVNYTMIEMMTTTNPAQKGGGQAGSPGSAPPVNVGPTLPGMKGFFRKPIAGGAGAAAAQPQGKAEAAGAVKCIECSKKAALFCNDCNDTYCVACFAVAHPPTLKKMSAHKSTPLAARRAVPMCATHDRPCELFCHEEHVLICSMCPFTDAHKSHQAMIVLLKDVAAQLCTAADAALADMGKQDASLARLHQKVKVALEEVATNVDASKQRVQARLDDLVQLVREQQQVLARSIDKMGKEMKTLLTAQDKQLADVRAELKEAQEGMVAMKGLAEGDMVMVKGKAAVDRTEAAMQLAERCGRVVCVADAGIPLHLPMDGAIERAIRGYGVVGGPDAPVWEAVKEEERGDREVKVAWGVVNGEEYEVEVKQIAVVEVGEDEEEVVAGGEGGAAAGAAEAGAAARKRPRLDAGSDAASTSRQARVPGAAAAAVLHGSGWREWRHVHRGAERTTVVRGLVPGHRYGMRVRGRTGGVVGKWSKVMVVETRERPLNMFDGMMGNVGWPGEALRLAGTDPTKTVNVKGRVGIEVRAGTGIVGYVEARVVRSGGGWNAYLALAHEDSQAGPGQWWGWVNGSCCWYDGRLYVQAMPGLATTSKAELKVTVGSTIGLMVDCRGPPRLRFFLDGVQVHVVEVGGEGEGRGRVWFPGGGVANGEMMFVDRPRMPQV